MKHLNLLCFAFMLGAAPLAQAQQYAIPQGLQANQYVAHKVIFKLKEEHRSIAQQNGIASERIQQVIQQLGGGSLHKNFPAAKQPRKKFNENGERLADLSLIYEINYNGNVSIYTAAELLRKTGLIDYAQPRFTAQPMATPNDPIAVQQYHHALIKSYEAWDVEAGDTNVVIAVTDGGIQFDHEDLGGVAWNYADPINGIDDDNNGYIDDLGGWNTANNTNDPTATLSPHGMFTSGMCSATVNNGLGVAGNGNKCRFLPVRIDDASGFNYGYEGIVYAAERGCQIINASWGNTFVAPMEEEVVRYASVNKGALIVAAAGNSGLNEKYYPASYENVMSIGATGAADLKWSGSTFSPFVDMVAPGELVRSCWPFNGYDISSGTSFSSPLVAGAAAIVKSHFPSYTAQQVAERLRVTADASIYSLSGNSAWAGLMGSGRLNMLRALNDPATPSVHFINYSFLDFQEDATLQAGEDVNISGDFKNFLAPTSNLTAVISCASPYISILNASNAPGTIGTLASTSNAAAPFSFHIADNAPYNLDVLFRIDYSDGTYSAFEYIEVRLNRDYLNIDINHLNTTITSRGSIGYNADYATDGLGVTVDSSASIIYASGFMIGSSATKTADNVYASSLPGYDNDFMRQQGAMYLNNDANQQIIQSQFYTDSASSNRLQITQRAEALSANPDDRAVMMHYTIKNVGSSSANALSAGIFTDWDIEDAANNQGAWDASRQLSYAFHPGGLYAGVKILQGPAAHSYCFNSDGAGGSVNLYDGFSGAEKFATLSGAQTRTTSTAGDIANLVGTGAFNLAAGDSSTISFVLLAANNLADLQAAADRAQSLFNYQQLQVSVEALNESCGQNDGFVNVSALPVSGSSLSLSTSQGVELTSTNDLSNFEYSGLTPGDYLLTYSFSDGSSYEESFTIGASTPVALSISASAEVIALPNASVDFTAAATGADSYYWDFNDDTPTSTEQNPTHPFYVAGTYIVTCVSSNGECSDTASIEILVGEPLGIATISSNIRVSPNPASDFIQVQLPENSSTASIQLFSINGQKLMHRNLTSQTSVISLSDFSNGVYMLMIESENTLQTKRIIVNR